jgi:hypothetical protein
VGRSVYPKLYVIENLLRITLHSILTAQLGQGWWQLAADTTIQGKATRFRNRYLARPWHTSPGTHDIYYVDLADLLEIARVNSHLLSPVIVDINNWVAQIDSIRFPRNITAHMNFANSNDRQRIEVVHNDLKALVSSLQQNPSVVFQIP